MEKSIAMEVKEKVLEILKSASAPMKTSNIGE